MIYAVPVLGHLIGLIVTISIAIPFWFLWSVCGIGAKFAYWLPGVYQSPGFWECVGLFMCVSILKLVFVPKLADVKQDASNA